MGAIGVSRYAYKEIKPSLGMSEPMGSGDTGPPFLLDQLTLSQPAHYISTCPPKDFLPSYGPEASQGPPRRWAKNLGRRKK